MKRNLLLVMVACLFAVSLVVAAGKGPGDGKVADTEAKALFVDNKCNSCHSIEKAGVQRKGGTTSSKIPDLSDVGSKHDAGWMSKFLKKENDLNGKKHTIAFKGTDEQLNTLTTWLESLKADTSATKGAMGAADTTKTKMTDTTKTTDTTGGH